MKMKNLNNFVNNRCKNESNFCHMNDCLSITPLSVIIGKESCNERYLLSVHTIFDYSFYMQSIISAFQHTNNKL